MPLPAQILELCYPESSASPHQPWREHHCWPHRRQPQAAWRLDCLRCRLLFLVGAVVDAFCIDGRGERGVATAVCALLDEAAAAAAEALLASFAAELPPGLSSRFNARAVEDDAAVLLGVADVAAFGVCCCCGCATVAEPFVRGVCSRGVSTRKVLLLLLLRTGVEARRCCGSFGCKSLGCGCFGCNSLVCCWC